ncbi:uncharacterized protein LOC143359170 [Halictus rubicundus]|uniref:uncharacterized protein LOC143359170 n=1 Tax=Halictus rubicundus TaxID=77578 RepID=UPI004035E769
MPAARERRRSQQRSSLEDPPLERRGGGGEEPLRGKTRRFPAAEDRGDRSNMNEEEPDGIFSLRAGAGEIASKKPSGKGNRWPGQPIRRNRGSISPISHGPSRSPSKTTNKQTPDHEEHRSLKPRRESSVASTFPFARKPKIRDTPPRGGRDEHTEAARNQRCRVTLFDFFFFFALEREDLVREGRRRRGRAVKSGSIGQQRVPEEEENFPEENAEENRQQFILRRVFFDDR